MKLKYQHIYPDTRTLLLLTSLLCFFTTAEAQDQEIEGKVREVIITRQRENVGFERISMNDFGVRRYAEPEESDGGIPALLINNGIIDDFERGIDYWWGNRVQNEVTDIAKEGGALKVTLENVGPLYTPFGKELTVPVNMGGGKLAVKVRAKAAGGTPPQVTLYLKDGEEHTTNKKPPSVTVALSDEYRDYYYELKEDMFMQSWPVYNKVSEKDIRGIMFFVNPGKSAYTGTLYIEDIQIIPAEEIPDIPEAEKGIALKSMGITDDFNKTIEIWWHPETLKLKEQEGILEINADIQAGKPADFGRGFIPANIEKAPIISLEAKADREVRLQATLKDLDGKEVTAPSPVTINATPDFNVYHFDFSQALGDINSKEVSEIIFEIIPETTIFSGKIILKSLKNTDQK